MKRVWGLLRGFACTLILLACGGDDTPPPRDAPPGFPPASLSQLVAFEGHRTLVNEITVGDGASLLGAVVAPAEDAPIDVVEQRCTQDRCGVVLSIRDETPNRGAGVPSPIDATNHFLDITLTTGEVYRGLLSVQPLDAISNSGSSATVSQPIVLASSLDVADRSEFIAGAPGPIRWVVFGDARFGAATFELGPSDEGPRAGGFAGGPTTTAGEGQGGGQGLDGAGGGGGGGRAEAGIDGGEAAGGTAGGFGGTVPVEGPGECVSDFARSDCGGGGGGGAIGAGGDGGGAFLLVTLGTLAGSGAFRAAGAAGAADGGGGGGGEIVLAGQTVEVAETDVAGGVGDGLGGSGGAGTLRIDSLLGSGVAVEFAGSPLVDSPNVLLSGVAPAGADVEIRIEGTTLASFVSDGTWSGSVTLRPGLNRLQLVATVDGRELRSWSGNGIELGRVAGSPQALPLGATLDLVHLP